LANSEEIIMYKNTILTKLINDKDVCQLILNRTISDMTDSDMQSEVKKYIRKYWYMPYTAEDEGTYITFDIGGTAYGQGTINKKNMLGLYVFTHHKLMECEFSPIGTTPIEYKVGTRVDILNAFIQKLLNGSLDFGKGVLKLMKDPPKPINNVYYGRELLFEVPEWSDDCENDGGI